MNNEIIENKPKKFSISAKSFIFSMIVIVGLMILSYILTFVLPSGAYKRILDNNGNLIIDTTTNPLGEYYEVARNFPIWKFILSPLLVIGTDGGSLILAIVAFLLIIGGVFSALTERNIIEYLLNKIINKYYNKRYFLLAILPLLFMLLASFAGCFEEIIPLIPIMCALTVALGWDNFTGLAMSFLACGCGYAAGIMNPFGTVVAQKVAGDVALFSGLWLRIVSFIILYIVLVAFLFIYVKQYEKKHPNAINLSNIDFLPNKQYDKAVLALAIIIGIGIAFIISSTVITVLQDYTLIAFALCFLIAGITSCFVSQMNTKEFLKSFGKGVVSMIPAAIMILFASSIKYILTESNTLDTLIKYLMEATTNLSGYVMIIFIYFVVLLMELFVPSGSAKAFLLIPLILPVAKVMGIPTNLIVLAYIFGDGLTNCFYPTNPGLIISLNLADTTMGKYFKATWAYILVLFATTCGILLFAFAINYH